MSEDEFLYRLQAEGVEIEVTITLNGLLLRFFGLDLAK